MRYTSPQITNRFSATDAVQSVGLPANEKDPTPERPDNPDTLPATTQNAYEADE